MSKSALPVGRGPRDDWYELTKAVTGAAFFRSDGESFLAMRVRSVNGRTVIRGGPEPKAIICMASLAGIGLLLLGLAVGFIAGTASISIGSAALLAGGMLSDLGAVIVFFIRPAMRMSDSGKELILTNGMGSGFHLNARTLIPRVTVSSGPSEEQQSVLSSPEIDSDQEGADEVYLKLYNIKLRQSVSLVKGKRDYIAGIYEAIRGMLGSERFDSTFTQVKLAGMEDQWADVAAEPEPGPAETGPADAEAKSADVPTITRLEAPMGVHGIIFSGARLTFPRPGLAIVELPLLRRIGLPLAVVAVLSVATMLVMTVIGALPNVSQQATYLAAEVGLAAAVICVFAAFWHYGGPITINRPRRQIFCRRRERYGFDGQPVRLSSIQAVQLCRDPDRCNYEVNLVIAGPPYRRLHLITDAHFDRAEEASQALAKFLNVPHWNHSAAECAGS